MKASRFVIVGLVLALLVSPVAWADSETADEDGLWGTDWVEEVVTWIAGLVTEEPDPVGGDTEFFSVDPTADEFQTTSSDDERLPSIDPQGNTAN